MSRLQASRVVCQTWWWRTSKDECKWFIAIWFILLKQKASMTMRSRYTISWDIINIYTQGDWTFTDILHTLCMMGPLCHVWLFFPSSSCSMGLLFAPRLEGRALPCSPYLDWPHFPRVPGTILPLCRIQVDSKPRKNVHEFHLEMDCKQLQLFPGDVQLLSTVSVCSLFLKICPISVAQNNSTSLHLTFALPHAL